METEKIKSRDEAVEAFAEIWAWAKLASIFIGGVGAGRYPNSAELAKGIEKDWKRKIEPLVRLYRDWLISAEK